MGNTRGSIFMVLAMAAFAAEDMFLKKATTQIPVGEALILFGIGGGLIFAALACIRREPLIHPAWWSRPLLWRAVCEIGGRLFFTLAIALSSLSTASAILQATPLFVSLGAIVFFSETVGARRWFAMLAGFAGVLLILRPGLAGFELTSVFALLGTLGFAGRDLATRASPVSMTNAQLGLNGFVMLTVAGVILLSVTGGSTVPSTWATGYILAASVVGVLAYSSLTTAMRTGEVSVISPFRYTRLIFAMFIGVIAFGERPDFLTIVGSALIVTSGLYTVLRTRRQERLSHAH